MIVAGSANPLLLASAGGYNLTRSLRFRSSASAYLNRTPASASNRKTWTWSGWIKQGSSSIADDRYIFSSTGGTGTVGGIFFNGGDNRLRFAHYDGSNLFNLVTTAQYRDFSAWYHVVVALDTTQATASNRAKIYVNGVQVTALDTASYPTLNFESYINSTNVHRFCIRPDNTDGKFDAYLTEVNFIDGQALTPSSFGQTSPTTGVWQPKRYAGTYGTNGFYLPFTDNSALTTSSNVGLGKDFSGNGNYWTTNNISITSGATYDSMTDVPTLTSATASNFAVMNPLDQAGGLVFSEANLRVTAATGWDGARATFSLPSTGKYYWETTCISRSTGAAVGLLSTTAVITGDLGAAATGYVYNSGDGNKYNNGSGSSYGATWGTNDIIGVSWDADTGTLVFYKNGTSQGTAWTGLSGTFSPAIGVNGSDSMNANFGQRPFAYTPPTGFVALNTFNLPTPTIGATASSQANKYMDVLTYTGNGTNARAVTGLNFQPDFVWVKRRNDVDYHNLFDVIRGATKRLFSNDTLAENTEAATLQSFNSNGFTVGTNDNVNANGSPLVAWNWKANGTGVTNTAGSITSTVSANTTSGFSVVTYTGNATSGATVGHGLGVAPQFIIGKSRTQSGVDWPTYHISTGNNGGCTLNETAAKVTTAGWWNNTTPSSTVVTLGSGAQTNGNTQSMVLYCFAEVAGYSKFGSYTGNGSTDGPFVFTGFRPKYVMVKLTSASGENWYVLDSVRNTFNVVNNFLEPNTSLAENEGGSPVTFYDFVSNGFKIRNNGSFVNTSGATYIYMAFAENPFKYSLAR